MIFEIETIGPRTIIQWHDERDNLDLHPSYQRSSEAWKQEDRAYLIDSILNGFDLPKFYFADFLGFANALNENRKRYAVIDGKQRLTAIFDFMDNKFPVLDTFSYINDPLINIAGYYYKDIQKKYPRISRRFDGYLITTVGVRTNDPNMILQMFMRLNRGARLMPAELRNASTDVAIKLARDLSKHQFFITSVKFANNRLQHVNSALKLLMMEYNEKPVPLKKKNIDLFLEESSKIENLEKLNKSYERTITILDGLHSYMPKKQDFTRSESWIPVVYWAARQNSLNIDKVMYASRLLFDSSKDPEVSRDIEFKRLGRNINDPGSIRRRAEIINELADAIVNFKID